MVLKMTTLLSSFVLISLWDAICRGLWHSCLCQSISVSHSCPKGYFSCNSTKLCVEQRQNCDGKADCEDGSDEWNCVDEHEDDFWNSIFPKRPDQDREHKNDCELSNSPSNCLCNKKQIICENLRLKKVPSLIPHRTTELDLSGNELEVLTPSGLQNLPFLKELLIRNSKVRTVTPESLIGLKGLNSLYFTGNLISIIFNKSFEYNNQLQLLDFSYNTIHIIEGNAFKGLFNLKKLFLRHNRINQLYSHVFKDLHSLTELFLEYNNLQIVKENVFGDLRNLQKLYLNHNQIYVIEHNAFHQLIYLQQLTLWTNHIEKIFNGTFQNQSRLLQLSLDDNRIRNIDLQAFNGLNSLESLNLQHNLFKKLHTNLFDNLTSLKHIYFDKFHMCSYALHVRVCEPRGDGISSIENLLDNEILRISVWIVAILACIGNVLVFVGRILSKEENKVHSFFIKNLSLADFFMGLYLFIIAAYDTFYRGQYLLHEEEWRKSWKCDLCGFLSTISSEVSVMTLTVITWDRYISIIYPLSLKHRTIHFANVLMIFLWLMCATIAGLPLIHNSYFGEEFYRNNGVCLPLYIHEPYAEAWEYSAFVFLGINFTSFVFIFFAYFRMFIMIKSSKVSLRSTQQNQDPIIAKRFAFIVSTDFICWIPVIIIKILALSGVQIDDHLYAWMAVFILPVNSALNPILYTLTTKLFKQHIVYLYKHVHKRSGSRASRETIEFSLNSSYYRSRFNTKAQTVLEADASGQKVSVSSQGKNWKLVERRKSSVNCRRIAFYHRFFQNTSC